MTPMQNNYDRVYGITAIAGLLTTCLFVLIGRVISVPVEADLNMALWATTGMFVGTIPTTFVMARLTRYKGVKILCCICDWLFLVVFAIVFFAIIGPELKSHFVTGDAN